MSNDLLERPDEDESQKSIGDQHFDDLVGRNSSSERSDGDSNSTSVSPDDIKSAEESGGKSSDKGTGQNDEQDAIQRHLGNARVADENEENNSGWQFKPEGKKGGARKRLGRLRHNRKLLVGGGLGIAGLALLGFGIFSFLGVFKLDFMLQNIDAKTFSRFNASFEGRSDMWVKSYMKLRMAEIEGSTDPVQDNLFFRANKVDTNNPAFDWYRSMRTSKFEQKVFNDNGITFESIAQRQPDGTTKFKTALVTVKTKGADLEFTFDPVKEFGGGDFDAAQKFLADVDRGDPAAFNRLGDRLDSVLNVQIFENNRDARRAVRGVVNDNTYFFQYLKRRQVRKDIQNMTGIRNWVFFEQTTERWRDRKISMQTKLLQKIFPESTNTGKFLQCLFGVGPCPRTADPVAPENRATVASSSGDSANTNAEVESDEEGNPRPGQDTGDGVKDSVTGAIGDGKAGGEGVSPIEAYRNKLVGMVSNVIGHPLAKVWSWMKIIANVHNAFSGENSGLVTLVKTAKRTQLMAIAANYTIARDQSKSGELSAEEMNELMKTIQGFENSEGWDQLTASNRSGTVSAQEALPQNISKDEYCSPAHEKQFGEYAWFCDDQRPSSAGRAEDLSDGYDKTVGQITGPIAAGVNLVKNSPIGWLGDTADSLLGKVTGPITGKVLEVTGLDAKIEDVTALGVEKIVEYSGAGPMYDGSEPGAANLLIAGQALTAESSTRASGGIASTQQSRAFTTQLAMEYAEDQDAQQSLYARYLSPENPQSLIAKVGFSLGNSNMQGAAKPGSVLTSITSTFGSIFSGNAFAQTNNEPQDLAEWAGVDRYDIPEVCMTLDPLSPTYLQEGTNADEAGITLNWETVRNETAFWDAVYGKLGDNPTLIQTIYNCHLFDQRVQGSMGAHFGYTNDGGLSDGPSAGPATSGGGVDASGCPSAPVTADQVTTVGGMQVHSCIASGLTQLLAKAAADGVPLTGYGWRDPQRQIELRRQNCGTSNYAIYEMRSSQCSPPTARPGSSNHEKGTAVDFLNCGSRSTACYRWLAANAAQFGLKNLPSEPWHWSHNGK